MTKVATNSAEAFDADYYQSADAFFAANRPVGLTFDDVSLATRFSEILPKDADPTTALSEQVTLPIPVLSSDMDTVTESRMAIAMALNGGLGLIHYNMPAREQVKEVARVKRHIHGLIQDPITVHPDQYVGDVLDLIESKNFDFRTFPVVDGDGKLVGLLSGSTVRERYRSKTVAEAMSPRSRIHTVDDSALSSDPIKAADDFFTQHVGIHKMIVVDDQDHLRGLATFSDVERINSEANARRRAARDAEFRLIVGAALSPIRLPDGSLDRDRITDHVGQMVDEAIDCVAISVAHGHSAGVGDMVRLVREVFPDLTIIAGNVTSAAGVEYLADCGANAIKVGQGPGSICTTRMVAGVGVPQLTAIMDCVAAAGDVPIIADGGIKFSGDFAKAIAAGASCAMVGSMIAGTDESPGEVVLYQGRSFKSYRGMGSMGAMARGSADRYFQKDAASDKLVPEGIEGQVPYKGSAGNVLHQLVGGLRAAMGYTGCATVGEMRRNCSFVKITGAGLKESHVHDVQITRESPNYRIG